MVLATTDTTTEPPLGADLPAADGVERSRPIREATVLLSLVSGPCAPTQAGLKATRSTRSPGCRNGSRQW